jgi:hypothetical protein
MEVGFLLPGSARRKKKNLRVVPIISQPAKTVYSTGTRTRARKKCHYYSKYSFLVASGIAVLAYGHPRPALALGA